MSRCWLRSAGSNCDTRLKKVAELLSDKRNEHVLSNGLSQKINRSTMKFDEVEEIVELLGYEIVFQKKKP